MSKARPAKMPALLAVENGMGVAGVVSAQVAGIFLEDLLAEALVIAAAVEGAGEDQLAQGAVALDIAVGRCRAALGVFDAGVCVARHAGLSEQVG